MAVPFHRLKVCGDILVAARGASIHTFNIADGSHIAAWRVPQPADKAEEAKEAEAVEQQTDDKVEEAAEAEGDDDVPSSKRRKVDDADDDDNNKTNGGAEQAQNGNGNGNGNGTSQKKKKPKKPVAKPAADAAKAQKVVALRTADLPVVSILEATDDGRHLVVMMGHDKTLRVLAHDLQGHLAQLSARVMPKRPCAVAFAADSKQSSQTTILSGDKFGDVYALPLLEVEQTEAEKAAEKEEAAAAAARKAEKQAKTDREAVVAPLRLEANQFTVHTKGNRQALENQRRQKELLLQQGLDQQKRDAENSSSEYQLLLGHVSMLTAVAVAEGYAEGEEKAGRKTKAKRPLILTADRDEHIRVSRGVVGATAAASLTHVIETFCLGHTSFVSRLCIPASRPDRLVSGGGDGELRVWNFWPEGQLVGTAGLASLVAGVTGETGETAVATPKVALSGLYAFGSARDPDAMTDDDAVAKAYIVATCERVPALFFFRLAADGATLAHTQTLPLPDGLLPLDVAEVGSKLVVATAAAEEETVAAPSSLLTLTGSKECWSVAETTSFASLAPATEADDAATATLDRAVLRRLLLHSNESLRKDSESEE
ncbi:tRNA (guanine-N(7)-)-methyltransferase non-catalytic subunit trm82 [Sporothrix curviconia]|uniref:tRNA (Guanine-N(7)-)-methyltransferase non-catalytic subunit trm82 n=1 Tax=Sporothrix curviconia TaxID=1260050 RepID=A0ABP0C7P7_9PEZI